MCIPYYGIGAAIIFSQKSKMHQFTFITSNPHKAEELSWHLDAPVAHYKSDLPEIQSLDSSEVISAKAKEAYKRLRRPVLVEDYSLVFDALGKLPGPLIKWFLAELHTEGLCKLLDSYDNRRASARVFFAIHNETGVRVFDASMAGTIAESPRGVNKYGTDGIFIPLGWSKTWGEMGKEEQIASSVRRIALKKLQAFLQMQKQAHEESCF